MRGPLITILLFLIFSTASYLLWRKRNRNVAQVPAYLDSYWDMLKEKRSTVRFKERIAVTCSVIEKRGNLCHVFSRDISGEGICLQVPEILPEGSPLDLKINIPSEHPVLVKGEVVWVSEVHADTEQAQRLFNTGIKIIKVGLKDKEKLGRFLESVTLKGKNR